jgi:Mor family transcriptional regulator
MECHPVSQQHLEDDAAVQLQSDLEQIISEWTGMAPPLAAPMAKLIVEGLRDRLGGKRVYVPAPRQRREVLEHRAKRDEAMVAMFNGRNVKDVMRAFDVSRRTVYNAVARAKPKIVQVTA